MEGPYHSIHRKGAQKGEYIRTPDWRAFRDYYEGCGGIIKLLDVAPECEGAEELIRQCEPALHRLHCAYRGGFCAGEAVVCLGRHPCHTSL